MSELTSYNSERIYWAVEQVEQEAGDIDDLHLDDNLFYLKSEADKKIAEKDKEIQRLENLCESYRIDCDNLAIREANACKEIGRDNKQIRHQKRKRCLAMARISQDDWHLHNSFYAIGHQGFEKRKCEFYEKWHKRWLELAEKFKPNKEVE